MELFQERLSPSWWLVLALFLFVPTSLLIFLPLDPVVGTGVGLALWLGSVGLLWWTSPVIRVDETTLSAGQAHIDLRFVARIEPIDASQARQAKGPGLDARAFVVIRPWISPAARIVLDDPRDPVPYWLVSTRQPERLVAAVNGARAGTN